MIRAVPQVNMLVRLVNSALQCSPHQPFRIMERKKMPHIQRAEDYNQVEWHTHLHCPLRPCASQVPGSERPLRGSVRGSPLLPPPGGPCGAAAAGGLCAPAGVGASRSVICVGCVVAVLALAAGCGPGAESGALPSVHNHPVFIQRIVLVFRV